MNLKILNQPLGMSVSTGAPVKKEIPLAIPLAMAGGSLLSSFWGGIKSKKAADAARQMQLDEKARVEAEHLRKTNESYLDTAAGQNMLRVARNEADKVWKRAEGINAVAGGTDAAAAMAKESGTNMIGETIANIAANDTQRKDAADAAYNADMARINQGLMQSEMQKAEATSQAAGAASNALLNGALTTFGGTKLGQSWFGTGGSTTGTGGTTVGGFAGGTTGTGGFSKLMSKVPGFARNSVLYNPQAFYKMAGWRSLSL